MAILRQLQGITVLLMVALPAMATAAGGSSSNIAPLSTVSASSENVIARQNAAKAVDGVISGFPADSTKEWATMGGKEGTWIRLDWAAPYTVDHVVLYDRPNPSDRIEGGTLLFSDGASVPVGALPNDGTGLTVTFAPRSVTWVKFTVDTVSSFTRSVGLAEFEVFGSGNGAPISTTSSSTSTAPTVVPANIGSLASVSASSQKGNVGALASSAVDGVVSGYPNDNSKEWETQGEGVGAWIRLDWPAAYMVDRVVLHDRINLDDQVLGGTLLFSDGTSVPVGTLPNDGTGLTVTFPPRSVTWIRFSVDSVSSTTPNVGLAEWEVYGVAASLQGSGSANLELQSSVQSDPPPMSVVSPEQLPTSSVTASSYNVTQGLAPANAVDGNVQTSWGVSSLPQSFVMDLGSRQLLSRVKMLIAVTQGGTNIGYSLQTSPDNQVWTQVFSGTSLSTAPQWTVADFEPVYARYVRVRLGSASSATAVKVYEIAPYGRNVSASASIPVNAVMTLSWQPNPEAVDGYLIYFGGSADTVNTQVAKVIAASTPNFDPKAPAVRYDSWYDFGLLPGDNVCFKVRAYNAGGASGFSTPVCGVIAASK